MHSETAIAITLIKSIVATPPFVFRNQGALVSVGSDRSAIGSLMGFITGHSYKIQGKLAMLFYRAL